MSHDEYDPRDDAPRGVCESCGEECYVVHEDLSFDHEFGTEKVIGGAVSSCCGAGVFEGGVSHVRTTIRMAKRDHKDGKVKAGEWYSEYVERHWRKGGGSWIVSNKKVLVHGPRLPYELHIEMMRSNKALENEPDYYMACC